MTWFLHTSPLVTPSAWRVDQDPKRAGSGEVARGYATKKEAEAARAVAVATYDMGTAKARQLEAAYRAMSRTAHAIRLAVEAATRQSVEDMLAPAREAMETAERDQIAAALAAVGVALD